MIFQKNTCQKICIKNVHAGCYSATLDCDDYKILFENKGYSFTKKVTEASAIIVHSCIVTNYSQQQTIREIEKIIRQKKKNSRLIIGGCVPEWFGHFLKQKYDCEVTSSSDLEQLVKNRELISEQSGFRKDLQAGLFHRYNRYWRIYWKIIFVLNKLAGWLVPTAGQILNRFFNTTYAYSPGAYFIRISLGCSNNCSYCTIKHARAGLKSRPVADIIREMQAAIDHGYREFILVSDDFPSYGTDLNTSYTVLMKKIFDLPGNFKISLYNFNPQTGLANFDEFIKIIKPGRIRSFHYPLQSGSDRILRLMNRQYTREQYLETSRAILEKDPHISLRTDIMSGFPGETENDFKETMEIIRLVPFETINLVTCDDRPDAPSARLPEKVPQKIAQRRLRQFRLVFRLQLLRRWWQLVQEKYKWPLFSGHLPLTKNKVKKTPPSGFSN
jgi:tRNA A37 methylthiotransferase MiaB